MEEIEEIERMEEIEEYKRENVRMIIMKEREWNNDNKEREWKKKNKKAITWERKGRE